MAKLASIINEMRRNPKGVRFDDLRKVCDFGTPRITGSHCVYKTPWQGDPRVNIQRDGNKAKPYQVRQVLKAIDRLEDEG